MISVASTFWRQRLHDGIVSFDGELERQMKYSLMRVVERGIVLPIGEATRSIRRDLQEEVDDAWGF